MLTSQQQDSGLFGLKGTGFGDFITDAGDFIGDTLDSLSDIPNRIIDFGRGLGNQFTETASQGGAPVEENLRRFNETEAGINVSEWIKNNSVLLIGGIGAVIFYIAQK